MKDPGLAIIMLSEVNLLTGAGFYYLDNGRCNLLFWLEVSTRTVGLLVALYWVTLYNTEASWWALAILVAWYLSRCAYETHKHRKVRGGKGAPKGQMHFAANKAVLLTLSQFSMTNFICNAAAWPHAGHAWARALQILLVLTKLVASLIVIGFSVYYPTYASAWHCYGSASTLAERSYGYCPQYTKGSYLDPYSQVCKYELDAQPFGSVCDAPLSDIAKSWQSWPMPVHSLIYVLLSIWTAQGILFHFINYTECV